MISIVIPTYNRPRQLAGCLNAVTLLNYPRDRFEVIVVDDGGTAPFDATLAPLRGQLRLAMFRQPHAGPAAARNAGAARANGCYLAFLDDDCAPDPNWLQTLAARLATEPGRAIGGRTVNALPQNLYSTASQLLIDRFCSYHNPDPDQASFFPSNNVAFPNEGFRAVGGFDEGFPFPGGEDRDLCERWRRHGYRLVYAPEVVVYHSHVLTLRSFVKQHFTYGRGACRIWRGGADRRPFHLGLRRLAFYVGLILDPLSRRPWTRALPLGFALAVSQLATAAGFLWEATSDGTLPLGAARR